MANDLTEQISKLPKERWNHVPWANLQGLVDCATAYLSSPGSSPSCQSISFLGRGRYNTVYRLVFSDGTHLAARISKLKEKLFNAEAKISEIETMRFVRDSGLYPDIPVPKVHAWDATFNNPVCAPYVLMDVVEGESLLGSYDENLLHGLDVLPHAQQLSVVKALAKLQASLSKPVAFDKIGSIKADAAGGSHFVGPLMTITQRCLGGPFKSVDELWRSCLKQGVLHALQRWHNLEKDCVIGDMSRPHPDETPQAFAESFQMLSSLIPYFKIPQACSHMVLHHPDIALRNVFFDKESLSSEEPKITGVIDWGGAQILPFMLTAHYPDDLMTSPYYPFARSGYPGDWWDSVPFDWTSTGNPNQWPKTMRGPGRRVVNHAPLVSATIRRFYLRAYFSACYAEQLHLLHGDKDLARATLFADAPYYLKFHETVCGGWTSWLVHVNWIRETYCRLRALGGHRTSEELLIIGPNVYHDSMKSMVRDLAIFEESPLFASSPLMAYE